MHCTDLLNHAAYPIDQPASPGRKAAVVKARAALAADGCALLRDFLSPAGLRALLGEAAARRPRAYFAPRKMTNAYLNDGDPALAGDHPVNHLLPRTNGFITSDQFGADTRARQFYEWPPLTAFIRDCLDKHALHLYADPVSNMIVNVGAPGAEFNWHFDTNEFTITMLLRPAARGGVFEYVPGLRRANDECYPAVAEVLRGARGRVKRLHLRPGDLQLFMGRFSLHRVTQNTGGTDRLLLIMSYAEQPGMIGSQQRVRQLYGKTAAAHANQRPRADGLRD